MGVMPVFGARSGEIKQVFKCLNGLPSLEPTVEIRAGSSPAFGTISTSKTIRESPNIHLKSMLAEIFYVLHRLRLSVEIRMSLGA